VTVLGGLGVFSGLLEQSVKQQAKVLGYVVEAELAMSQVSGR
jgi:hypothetical protein